MNKMITLLTPRIVRGITLLLLLWPATMLHAQEYASYLNGQKVYHEPSTTQALVKFKDAAAQRRHEKAPKGLRVKEIRPLPLLANVSLVTFESDLTKTAAREAVKQLANEADISQAAPVLLNAAGKPFGGVTDQFIIKLKPTTSLAQLQQLLQQTGTTIDHQYEFDSKTYFISYSKRDSDVMAKANYFYESGLVEFSEPNFVLFVDKTTNDPFYTQQWALNNTGQTGGTNDADMDVAEAWSTSTGSNIRVAVLDDGVQLNHPDLAPGLLPGFDATGAGSGGGPNSNDPHGTACAGIIGARANNGLGTAGVAYSSSIIPIRVFTGAVINQDVTTAGWMAAGIDWAAQNNRADVLSLSLIMRVSQQIITDALNRAVTQGRNGLGCLVLAATGNDNRGLEFPASAPSVIAVGASTNRDRRAEFSNFGAGLDLVAPGVGLYTTDLQGTAGYSGSDYNSSFSGTSGACPSAAGVAALILSINPNLTYAQARQILESTADKPGGYTYTTGAGEVPSLTWNSEMGYGRVNACQATRFAVFSLGMQSASNYICPTQTFTIPNLPAGMTTTWSTSNSNVATINPTTGVATRVSDGPVNILATVSAGSLGCEPIFYAATVTAGPAPVGGSYYNNGTYTLNGFQYVSTGSVTLFMSQQQPGTTYSFSINPSSIGITQSSPSQAYFQIGPGGTPNQRAQVTVTATTACGSSSNVFDFYVPGSFYFTYAPNPVSDELTVSAIDQGQPADGPASTTAPAFEAELYDDKGKKVKTKSSDKSRAKLDVRDLPSGLYTLRVGKEKEAISARIQVTH